MKSERINERTSRVRQQALRADGRQHDGISFLDLPAEIRIVVYRLCLLGQHGDLKPNGKPPSISIADFPLADGRAKAIVATVQKIHPFTRPESVRSYSGANAITISLLRLSKQIHQEAAVVLYSENKFRFVLADHHYTYRDNHYDGYEYEAIYKEGRKDFVEIEDNLTRLAPVYLRMIKQSELAVKLPIIRFRQYRHEFARFKARIASFADAFGGNDHSLQTLHIRFLRGFNNGWNAGPYETRMCHRILEPLATIYGIERSVRVEGPVPEFSARLTGAMTSRILAVTPKEENYKTRLVKAKGSKSKGSRGKKVLQKYRLEPYYVTKYVWIEPSVERQGTDIP